MKHLSQDLFAQMLREKRCAKCITQEQVSESTGISIDVIGKMEGKEHIPSIPELEKLSELLDFSIETLFVDSANPSVCIAHQDKDLSPQDKDGILSGRPDSGIVRKSVHVQQGMTV